jgi:hypothetical protein
MEASALTITPLMRSPSEVNVDKFIIYIFNKSSIKETKQNEEKRTPQEKEK